MAELHFNEQAAPAKVDLGDGVEVYRTSAWAPPGCHGVGCGLKVFVRDGKLVKVEGDPDHPITRGRLCPRCMAIKDYVEHPDRLRYPMKRAREFRGRADKWERITWDEAYAIILENWESVRERYGKNAIGVFAGTGREASRYHFTMAQDVFGSNTAIQSISGWSCIIPRMAGMAWIIGAPYLEIDNAIGFPERYDSDKWECPKYILNWGRDPLRSNPDGLWGHSFVDMMKRGAKLINVDPRVNWLSVRSAYYLQLRPGTDAALALGILNEVIRTDAYDHEFVEAWTYGFDELAARASEYPAEKVAEICEVDAGLIRAVARCLLEKPCTLSMGLAVDQNPNSIQIAHALLAIFAITGNIDIPGGVFLGQPLLMFQALQGESSVPEEADGELGIGHDVYPALPKVANTPHPDIVLECLETGRPQRIEFAYFLNTNPLACMPAQPQRWFEALRKIEFVACADIFMTPTMAALADVVLPICSSLERDGIVTNNQASMHGQLGAMVNVIDRVGETKSDLEIAIDLHRLTHPECTDQKWRSVEDFLTSDLAPVARLRHHVPRVEGAGVRAVRAGVPQVRERALARRRRSGLPHPHGTHRAVLDHPRLGWRGSAPVLPRTAAWPLCPSRSGERLPAYHDVGRAAIHVVPFRTPSDRPSARDTPVAHRAGESGYRREAWHRAGLVGARGNPLGPREGGRRHHAHRQGRRGVLRPWLVVSRAQGGGPVRHLEDELQPAHASSRAGKDGVRRALQVPSLQNLSGQSGSGRTRRRYRTENGGRAMTQYGIMVDNEFCTGCHTCELACKNEHDLPLGQWGVKVLELGPWKREDGYRWEFRYVPVLTGSCDLCADRTLSGGVPHCVQHCPAAVMEYGTLDDLAVRMAEKGRMASILVP